LRRYPLRAACSTRAASVSGAGIADIGKLAQLMLASMAVRTMLPAIEMEMDTASPAWVAVPCLPKQAGIHV